MLVYSAPIYGTANTRGSVSAATVSWATTRLATAATTTPGTSVADTGISAGGGTTAVGQYFITFDTSAIPVGTTSASLVFIQSGTATAGDFLEVREVFCELQYDFW